MCVPLQEQRSEDNLGATALYCHVHKLWWVRMRSVPQEYGTLGSRCCLGRCGRGSLAEESMSLGEGSKWKRPHKPSAHSLLLACGSRCELSASCPCRRASPAMMDSLSGAKAKETLPSINGFGHSSSSQQQTHMGSRDHTQISALSKALP